ncbi:hypothetical protein AFE_2518 [Acidithiobacillus ferrooxidans ATCC 23270]|uniref:Uncharacterized protein n=1 Tax=Acidithiobacillus ferrooxidans (strain ATCC 23270 / DSM 14882 / CIP 104768 / NCIMB 8455) TaxID=243159 RepID=B7J753_ACIF2|nr:hypothetical protein AFE_2518 [Acidithiobacillus ferrooxidans ATCC 23270]
MLHIIRRLPLITVGRLSLGSRETLLLKQFSIFLLV